MIEGYLALLQFDVRSIRSAHSFAQRNQAIDECNDPNSNVDVLICGYKTTGVGVNIQRGINNLVHFELPWTMGQVLQANGRCHRLGQTKPQEIVLLRLDGTYDMICQYRIWNKFLPQIIANAQLAPPENFSDEENMVWLTERGAQMMQTLLGARASRLNCGNAQHPYSFEICPPGSTPNPDKYHVVGMS